MYPAVVDRNFTPTSTACVSLWEATAGITVEFQIEHGQVCVAATRLACSVAGCAAMSASRFTVACCIARSVDDGPKSCSLSRPHDHCTVPALNTSAPLGARYSVRLWVAVPGP